MKIMKRAAAGIAVLLLLLCAPCAAAAAPGDLLTPGGQAVAIELTTEGLIVAGIANVETAAGTVSPAGTAGMLPGDRITAVNGVPVPDSESFAEELGKLGGEVTITAEREGETLLFTFAPAAGTDGTRYLGLWLREGISGIGTLTFRDPKTGLYGALGHGVSASGRPDALTPITGGAIAPARVTEVVAGRRGTPGELIGCPASTGALGTVIKNTPAGIFGLSEVIAEQEAIPAAADEEIRLGAAEILTTLSGCEPCRYAVEITRIVRGGEDTRRLSITVTDPRLLQRSGGIVQGMSGSPILQNGKLIGAVTHVLVDDPTRGYGVTIETMLREAA